MTREEIIGGLQFTVDMFLFDPSTGETYTEPRNDMDKTTIDACKGAIELLEQPRWIPVSERLPKPYTYVNATCRSLVDDRANWVVETLYLPIPKENNERGYSDWGNIPMLNWHKAEVVAWMERKIPEPYKPERSKND